MEYYNVFNMASETDDWDFEDEDTAVDVHANVEGNEVHDTEQPPSFSSMEMATKTAHGMRHKVVAIERISVFPSRELVIQKICEHANLEPGDLEEIPPAEGARGLFYEYRCRVRGVYRSYVYVAKTCKDPSYTSFGNNIRVPMAHPGATVLLKVRVNGTTEVVCRWGD